MVGLLLHLAGAHLRLCALQSGILPLHAKARVSLPAAKAHVVEVLSGGLLNARLLRRLAEQTLRCLLLHGRLLLRLCANALRRCLLHSGLLIGLRSDALCRLLLQAGLLCAHAVEALAQPGLRLRRAKALPVLLLTERRRLLRAILLRHAVRLIGRQVDALLLRELVCGLPVSRLQDVSQRRLIGEGLLTAKLRLRDARPIATKRAGPDSVAGHGGTLLRVFLFLQRLLRSHHTVDVGRHERLQRFAAELLRVDVLRAVGQVIARQPRVLPAGIDRLGDGAKRPAIDARCGAKALP